MRKIIRFLMYLFYKLHNLYMLLTVLVAELLLTMGDLSIFLIVPDLAPTIFMIAAIIFIWEKWGNRKAIRSLFNYSLNLAQSLMFWSYAFVWISPFPKID